MGSILFVVFSYNRERMLLDLRYELDKQNLLIIDDGSEWLNKDLSPCNLCNERSQIIRTIHEGKQGFWKKWLLARQIALGTDHDYFVFLPDDVSNVDIEAIQEITKQGWTDNLFALNLCNTGERYRWGKHREIQEDFELAGRTWQQCDYVDGAFITNRATLTAFDIEPVPKLWFDRPDKSSGVGYQMTMKLRAIGCPMMLPSKSLAYHGDHESVMHKNHRLITPLISK